MKVEGKPLEINENTTLHIKPLENGEAEVTRVDHIGDTEQAHRSMQSDCKTGTEEWRGLESGGKRLVATMPESAANEMQRQCGDDPEKRNAFLRDHPEFHTSRQVRQDIKKRGGKKKTIIY